MTPYYQDDAVTLYHGDALRTLRSLPNQTANTCITSPPYFGLRDYGHPDQYGLEDTPAEYIETMRAVFSEVRRVLADDGTLWLNLGDSYSSAPGWGRGNSSQLQGRKHEHAQDAVRHVNARAGTSPKQFDSRTRPCGDLPPKNMLGIPWRVAFALQDDGWILRNSIIWHKPNAMPESVTDRLGNRHETVFLFAKSPRYWFDLDQIREPTGRNPGDMWSISTTPFPGAHFATMTQALAERCIVAGCPPNGTALDPFSGSGTTGMAATKHGRHYIGIDLSADYLDLSLRTRLGQATITHDHPPANATGEDAAAGGPGGAT